MSRASQPQSVRAAVRSARARLGRIEGRQNLRRHGPWVLALAAAIGAARPLLLRLDGSAPLWAGVALSLGLTGLLGVVGLLTLVVVGRLGRPSELASARAIDEALELRGVIAGGWELGQVESNHAGPMAALVDMARRQAEVAAPGFDSRCLPLPSLWPRGRDLLAALAVLALVAIVGSYHPTLSAILLDPPTERELATAEAIERYADELERRSGEADETGEPEVPSPDRRVATRSDERRRAKQSLAQRARQLAEAARQGRRADALAQLDDLDRQGRAALDRSEALREALRRLAEALTSRPARPGSEASADEGGAESSEGGAESSDGTGDQQRSAAEQLEALARQLGQPAAEGREEAEEQRRALEALARAVAEAEQTARESGDPAAQQQAERLAEALRRAGSALGRGDRAEASRRLERALEQTRAMASREARAASEAEAIARLLQSAGALGRQMQLALASRRGEATRGGRSGRGQQGQGRGEGRGGQPSSTDMARALAMRLAALGMTGSSPSGQPGAGREGSTNNSGPAGEQLPVTGAIRSRSVVSEGERAITAIRGLGRSDTPSREYRDVYPTYSALAEESMADEVVPTAQRQVVRRYFQSIRPGGAAPQPGE